MRQKNKGNRSAWDSLSMRTSSSSLTRHGQALPSFPGAESVLLHLAGHICQRHRGMQELPQDFTFCMFNLISQKNLQAIKKQLIHINEHQQLVLYQLKLGISSYLNSCATIAAPLGLQLPGRVHCPSCRQDL